MSNERDLKQIHSQTYEQMTAEELAAVLRADAEADSSSALDDETLLYIMRLYAQRQEEKPAKTAQEAFAAFQRDYLPRVNEPSVWTEEELIPKPTAKIKRWLPLTAAAAALALVLGVGTIANSHLLKDSRPTYWQNGDYLVVSGNYNAAAARNISDFTEHWYPEWLPEGYELSGISGDGKSCHALYQNGMTTEVSCLSITFQVLNASGVARFSKNPGNSKTVVHDGVQFHLYTNMGRNCAVGYLKGIVIYIDAPVSHEEIVRIIESMQLH